MGFPLISNMSLVAGSHTGENEMWRRREMERGPTIQGSANRLLKTRAKWAAGSSQVPKKELSLPRAWFQTSGLQTWLSALSHWGNVLPASRSWYIPQVSHLCAITTPNRTLSHTTSLNLQAVSMDITVKKKKLENWKVTCLKPVTKKTADLTHTLQLYLTGVSKLMQFFPLTLEVTFHRSSNGIASIRTSCLSSNGGHKVPLCHYIPLNSHAPWRHPFPLGNIL